jgi:hypothetical protein
MNRSPERQLKGSTIAENRGVKTRADLSTSEVVLAATREKVTHIVDLCEVVLAEDGDATNPVEIKLIADNGTTEVELYRFRFGPDQKDCEGRFHHRPARFARLRHQAQGDGEPRHDRLALQLWDPPERMNVQTPGILAPSRRRRLLPFRDPFTSNDGWTPIGGSPAFAGGEFSGGLVGRDLRAAPNVIKFAVGQVPQVGESAGILFCVNEPGGSEYYNFGYDHQSFYLLKDQAGAPLGSWVSTPVEDTDCELRVVDGGDIELWVAGTKRINSANTDRRSNTLIVLYCVGAATIKVHSVTGRFFVN